jgi:hypothetical protein
MRQSDISLPKADLYTHANVLVEGLLVEVVKNQQGLSGVGTCTERPDYLLNCLRLKL